MCKLAAACLDDDGNRVFEDKKPEGGEWTETACETAGGTFKAGLQRSEVECTSELIQYPLRTVWTAVDDTKIYWNYGVITSLNAYFLIHWKSESWIYDFRYVWKYG